MEEDTVEEVREEFKERRFGGWGILQLTVGTGLAVYAVWAGILMPGFRRVPLKLQVPYLPASRKQVRNVMTLLKGRSGGLADLGSGDGRIDTIKRNEHVTKSLEERCHFMESVKGSPDESIAECCRVPQLKEENVLEAYRQGFHPAVGYELNPWLVRLSYFHAWRRGHAGKVSYLQEDLWKVSLANCKNVTVFLAPSVLPLLQDKLLAELPEDAMVVAGRFPFSAWTPCKVEGDGADRAWAYHIQAQRLPAVPAHLAEGALNS